jgi:hypothetical protein
MDRELTDDEHLQALAALEAVVGNNERLAFPSRAWTDRSLPLGASVFVKLVGVSA